MEHSVETGKIPLCNIAEYSSDKMTAGPGQTYIVTGNMEAFLR